MLLTLMQNTRLLDAAAQTAEEGTSGLLTLVLGLLIIACFVVALFISSSRRGAAEAASAPAAAVASMPVAAPAPAVQAGISPEIVAAIAGAIASAEGGPVAIRSISRAASGEQGRNPWALAGVLANTEPF